MKTFINTLLLSFLFVSAYAQTATLDSCAWFTSRDYGKYFKADHYAPNIRINGGISLRQTEYNIDLNRDRKFIPINETVLGGDIPIYQRFWKNNALSLSIPISFSDWFDFTELETAPILNTDYRFAVIEINYLHKFQHPTFRNIGIKFIPFFHESTHIGDELTLARIRFEAPIVRINVSYESTSLAITLNDPLKQQIENHTFRFGAKFLLNPTKGWYSFSKYEGDITLVPPSERWAEANIQYEYQNPNSFLSFGKSMFIISADLSYRVKLGYPYHENIKDDFWLVETTEKHLPCFNALMGWQLYNSNNELSNLGIYLRAYTGINYHGQFRNLPDYQFYGFTVIYDL